MEKNPKKIDWWYLSLNPNALHLLEKNPKKIWDLSNNPDALHLFCDLDYEKMRENRQEIAEELCERVFHPIRVCSLSEKYGLELTEYLEILGF